jgi:hypothetical protein
MNALLVRARFDMSSAHEKTPWKVRKNDLGVLKWKRHQKHIRFLEPRVVWDDDPQHLSRRVILSAIAVAGIDTGTTRILVSPARRLH